MRAVDFTRAARWDLIEVRQFIASDNPYRAVTFVEEHVAVTDQIVARPLTYPARLDLGRGLRSASHGKYLILFRVLPNAIVISRVVHGARDLRRLRFPRR